MSREQGIDDIERKRRAEGSATTVFKAKPSRKPWAPALHLPVRLPAGDVTAATIARAHEAGIDLNEPGEGYEDAANRINEARARLAAIVAAKPIAPEHVARVVVVLDKETVAPPYHKAARALYPKAERSWVRRADLSDVCGSAVRVETLAGYFATTEQHMATSRAILDLADEMGAK